MKIKTMLLISLSILFFTKQIYANNSSIKSKEISNQNPEKERSLSQVIEKSSQENLWLIKNLGTLSTFDEAFLVDCNKNGQALIHGRLKPNPYEWVFWDPDYGLLSLPTSSDGWGNEWIHINEKGLVIGLQKRAGLSQNAFYYDLVTWSIDQGCKTYKAELENKKHLEKESFFAFCRNSDSVVINRQTDNRENNQILVLHENQLTDITPSLQKQALSLGFEAGGWLISHINSRGMLLGKFFEYTQHPYKKTKFAVSTHYFIQNGDEFYLINSIHRVDENGIYSPFRENAESSCDFSFDSKGRFFSSWVENEYVNGPAIWNCQDGLNQLNIPSYITELAEKEGALTPKPIELLDDGTMVWLITCQTTLKIFYILENNENFWIIPSIIDKKSSLFNANEYPGIAYPKGNYIPIFMNKYSSFFLFEIVSENHPFMLSREP